MTEPYECLRIERHGPVGIGRIAAARLNPPDPLGQGQIEPDARGGHVQVARDLLQELAKEEGETVEAFPDEEEGEDLCNCTFSLAYGAKILLNTATLRLKRGHRYGLCGRNGSGKSTLMRAIDNGQVEGFPSPDEVRTFYVEHDVDGDETENSIVSFVLKDKRILKTEEEIRTVLESVGFTRERQEAAIGSLSGGWKMKLALARAILFEADILLLDEPTNHLDVLNVAWLENYLCSLKTCTSIIVSHDSGFLNNVCTDILHLNKFKVKRYPGNLDAFVKFVPEARAYYELNPLEDYNFKMPAVRIVSLYGGRSGTSSEKSEKKTGRIEIYPAAH